MNRDDKTAIAREIKAQVLILAGFVAVMWLVELVDIVVFHQRLNIFGVHPRRLDALWGIFFMPFLHGGLPHLLANTIPFITLGWLVMLRDIRDFWVVTVIGILTSGLGVWLIGASGTVHIGASGLVFSYLGYLLLRGYFERSFTAIFLSVVVGIFYGSLVFGVLPLQQGVSWEGHLFGFLGGALSAYLLAERPQM